LRTPGKKASYETRTLKGCAESVHAFSVRMPRSDPVSASADLETDRRAPILTTRSPLLKISILKFRRSFAKARQYFMRAF